MSSGTAPLSPPEPASEEQERLRRPALGPTMYVVGRFETPAQVKDNPPDMPLIHDARRLLGYQTNYTLLEWWAIFPVGKWWRFAIAATRHFSTSFNYKYFLRCLRSAAYQDKIYHWAVDKLKHLAKVDLARQMYRQKQAVAPKVCEVCGGRPGGCEACDPTLVMIREKLPSLKMAPCPAPAGCDGKVCYKCAKSYLRQLKNPAQNSARLVMNWGAPEGAHLGGACMTQAALVINRSTHEFTLNGRPLRLTLTEVRLLLMLLESPGVMVKNATLAQRLWGLASDRHLVRKYISHLRIKMGDDCKDPRWIAKDLERKRQPRSRKLKGVPREYVTGYKYVGPQALVLGHSDILPFRGPVQEQRALFPLAV